MNILEKRVDFWISRSKAAKEEYESLTCVERHSIDLLSSTDSLNLSMIFGSDLIRPNGVEKSVSREEQILRVLGMLSHKSQSTPKPYKENADGQHPGMVFIPHGPAQIGVNNGLFAKEEPQRTVVTKGFWIDIDPVTNLEYEIAVGRHRRDIHSKADDSPVTAVTWFEAQKYCSVVGKRLPTSVEWERASRSDTGWLYSVSADFNSEQINAWPSHGPWRSEGQPRNSWGIALMAGNVWEWTWGVFKHTFGESRNVYFALVRGGSWRHCSSGARVVSDLAIDLVQRCDNIGFRCVLPAY